jgi:hypothetical protein
MSKFEKSMNGYFARQQQQQSQPPPSSQNAPPLTPAAKREMLINRAGLAMLELANTPRSQRFQLAPPPLNAATSLTNNSKFQHQEPAPSSRIWPAEKTEMELYLRSLPPLPDSPDIPAPPTPIIAAAAAAATEESVEKNLKPPLLASEAANPASPAIVTDLNSINIPPPPPPLLAAASGNTNPHQPLLPSTANTNEDDTCALFFATAPRSGTGFDPLHLRQETPQRQLQGDSSDTGGDFDTPTSEERRCILRELERLNELEAQILAEMNEDDLKIPQATTSIPTVATASQRRFFTLDDFGRRI